MEQWALGRFNSEDQFQTALGNVVHQRHAQILTTLFEVDEAFFNHEE
jgi:hypothetical protein